MSLVELCTAKGGWKFTVCVSSYNILSCLYSWNAPVIVINHSHQPWSHKIAHYGKDIAFGGMGGGGEYWKVFIS